MSCKQRQPFRRSPGPWTGVTILKGDVSATTVTSFYRSDGQKYERLIHFRPIIVTNHWQNESTLNKNPSPKHGTPSTRYNKKSKKMKKKCNLQMENWLLLVSILKGLHMIDPYIFAC